MSNMNGRSVYTAEGLRKLSLIVKTAMGGMSYREFEGVTGISHGVIRRIVICDSKMPDKITLERLAYPTTPYTFEQLQLILMEREIDSDDFRQFRTALDIFPLVTELPDAEMAELVKMIVDRLVERTKFIEISKAGEVSPATQINRI